MGTPLHLPGLTLLCPLTWESVFEIWRANEGDESHWGAHARSRGFPDWASWRMTYANAWRLPEREWRLYELDDAMLRVPEFRGGPFRSWVQRFYAQTGITLPRFSVLATLDGITTHSHVRRLMGNFPQETTLTGLHVGNSDIATIEGMHRCCAIAVASAEGKRIETRIRIALADAEGDELPVVGMDVQTQQ